MTTQPHDLNERQIARCIETMPAFKAAYEAVQRMKADVQRNRQQFAPAQAEPVNIHSLVRKNTWPAEVKVPIPSIRSAK